MAALEALAGFGHLQEVILQNFVPHRRYYGEEPADIATERPRAYWRTGLHEGPTCPRRHGRRRSPSRTWSASSPRRAADARGRHPDPAEPRRLVAAARRAGATDLGGCRPTATTSRPSTRSRRPHQVRKRLARTASR
jgi:FO synthase